MSGVGGSAGFDATATITIRDGSPLMPTGAAAIPSGTYGPTASNNTTTWPAPAPAAPYNFPAPAGAATFASIFNNTTNWNGTWNLYVNDNTTGDIGSIAGGWGITLVPPSTGCTGTPITFTYTVNPTPIATATPSTQTICSGDAIAPIVLTSTVAGTTYSWTRNNTATVTGIAASGSGTPITGSLTNTTPLPITVTFTITPTSPQGCVGLPITATVIVNPRPVMTATPAAQTICNGVTITPIVFASTTPGTTYTWTRDNTSTTTAPGGIPASGSGNSITGFMINTTFAPILVTFTITPTAAGCVGTPVTATVLIQPTTTAVATPAFQVSCSGSPIIPIVLTSPVLGTVYRWTRDNAATATGIAANGIGNISGTLTTTATTPITVTFTIIPSINGCDGPAIIATDTVRPTPSVNTPANQTLCNGSTTTAVSFTSPVPGTIFNWTNNTPSIGLVASGSGNIPSFTATNTGNAPVTATITITPIAAGCPGTSVTFTITVNPTAVVNAVANQTLCAGQSTAAITFSSPTTGSPITYSWTNNTPSIGLAASGTGNIPSFVAVNNTPTAVTATITVTPNSGAGCIGVSRTFTITVNGLSVAPTAATSSKTVNCGPTTVDLAVVGGALGTGAIWRWYTGSCGGTFIGTGPTLNNVPISATTTYFVRAEGTCNTTTCASVTVTINVQPTISIAAAPFTSLLPPQTTNLTATINPSLGTNTIVWYLNNNIVSGATTANLNGINVDRLGTYTARVTTQEGCTALSNAVLIKDEISDKLWVYPNPNDGRFKIRYYTAAAQYGILRNAVIYDRRGQLIQIKPVVITGAYTSMDIDIRNYPKGLYYVKITDQWGKQYAVAEVDVLR
jgi:subtilisin-like proprotein convertase family protein